MPDLTALSRKSGISVPVLQAIASAGRRHAQRVVLYGSRARGDHQPESDIDIAFFGSNEGFFRFETCMEQLPTLLDLDVHSPKAVMRKAYAEHIITDEAGWLALLDARNQTSHLYDDEVASAVYQAIEGTYLPLLRALSEKLSAAV